LSPPPSPFSPNFVPKSKTQTQFPLTLSFPSLHQSITQTTFTRCTTRTLCSQDPNTTTTQIYHARLPSMLPHSPSRYPYDLHQTTTRPKPSCDLHLCLFAAASIADSDATAKSLNTSMECCH